MIINAANRTIASPMGRHDVRSLSAVAVDRLTADATNVTAGSGGIQHAMADCAQIFGAGAPARRG
jgi:hypothetical protein